MGEFVRTRVLRPDEARKNLRDTGLRQAYSDPHLREPKTYRSFIRRLLDADIIELCATHSIEKVEMFFVGKKDGRLRMVCDCRRSNCHFAKPEKVRLCTAETLTRIELPPDSCLHIATADLKDAFYHFQLPAALRTYFGMRGLQAGEVGVTEIEGCSVSPDKMLYPRLKVLPMGWSHALFWCQRLHEHVVNGAGASFSSCLQDKTAVPFCNCMQLEYVDNYVVLGTDPEKVSTLAASGVNALRSKGLVVHEVENASAADGPVQVLGWQFEGTRIQPVPHRVWRIILAVRHLLKVGVATGKQVEKVVGHAAFISLGRRE